MSESLAKVMFVDDQEDNLFILKKLLENLEMELHLVSSGSDAVRLTREHEFALIVLDVQMDGIDGYKTAELIRHFGKSQNSPIIFLTAAAIKQEDVEKGYTSGAIDYIFKPPNPYVLQSKVQVFLNLFRQKQLIERQKHELNHALEKQKAMHRDLVAASQELSQSKEEISQLYEQLQDDLSQAQLVQHALLPTRFKVSSKIRLATKFIAMDKLGGDLYDFIQLDAHRTGLFLMDVSGHGIGASLISCLISGLLKTHIHEHTSPRAVLLEINDTLVETLPSDKFATAFLGIYDDRERMLTYCSAGHPNGVRLSAGGQISQLNARGTALGMISSKHTEHMESKVRLDTGDRLLLYTDGIAEMINEHNEMYGEKRMLQFIQEHLDCDLQPLVEHLYQDALKFGGQRTFNDDITLVAMEVV